MRPSRRLRRAIAAFRADSLRARRATVCALAHGADHRPVRRPRSGPQASGMCAGVRSARRL